MNTCNANPIIHLVIGTSVCSQPGGGVSPNMLNDVNCEACIGSEEYIALKKGYAIIRRNDKRRDGVPTYSIPSLTD